MKSLAKLIREEGRAFLLIAAAILLFFPEIALLKKGFLSGDHRLQHYPWFYLYWQGLKNFTLPWWTTFNQCGFPLVAEGQVGAFYPLNFIFAFLFPLRFAYNYSALAHYLIGGIFFYLYCRRIRFERIPALWATLVFLFGSSQGGFFYNVTSQRVLIWFPLALILVHRLVERMKLVDALSLGVVFAVASVAGYQQYAVYSMAFSGFYFLGLWGMEGKRAFSAERLRGAGLFLLALLFSFLVALPQWAPFLELAKFSAREGLTEEFAYLGSMPPVGPLTLFFPSWQGILRTELYVGILGLFFVFFALAGPRSRETNLHLGLALLSLLLAWGMFSPLYVGLVKLTKFYGFRTPVKFLFFTSVSLAVVSGWGFQQLLSLSHPQVLERVRITCSFFSALLGLLTFLMLAGSFALRFWRASFMGFFEMLLRKYVVGRPYRPHTLEVYLEKLSSFYEQVLRNVNPLNPRLLVTLLMFLAAVGGVYFLQRQKRAFKLRVLWVLLGILFLDLYLYGNRNIRGDYENFSFVHRPSEITESLKGDRSRFRHYLLSPNRPWELVTLASNSNILDGEESIGVYSPLAFREYKKRLEGLGAVDDSLGFKRPGVSETLANLDLLRFLNVKYVLSTEEIGDSALEEILREENLVLYQLKGVWPRFLFVPEGDFDVGDFEATLEKVKPLRVRQLDYDQGRFELVARIPGPGYLLASELNYPGWKARVDGRETKIASFVRLFKAVEVKRGERHIEVFYEPTFRAVSLTASFVSLLIYFFLLVRRARERGRGRLR